MNCQRIAQWLPLYASADLTASQLDQVRAHLAQCATCTALASDYAATREWLQTNAQAEAPEFDETFYADLRYAVVQELAQQPPRLAWWPLRWRWQPLAVVAALLLLLIFSVRILQTKGVPRTNFVKVPALPQMPDVERTPTLPKNELAQTPKTRVPLRKQAHALRIKQKENQASETALVVQTARPVSDAVERVIEPVMSRVEIQTADPNIRIIWLTPVVADATPEPLTR